ncbi:MAG: helix-turn-helix transcriptional regulator [Marmoricola sp.]
MQLLEREQQLGSLTQYAEEARTGHGRLVLVAGEAGAGKSSLVELLEERLPDARWARGSCDGLFIPRPLAPLYDAAGALGGHLADLVHQDAPRDVLFTALLEDLARSDRLTVLVIEDLHWADEATLDLVQFLARRLRSSRVLLIGSYRDDELAPDDPLRSVLGVLSRLRSTRRIGVPPLSRAAVDGLAAGSGISGERLHRLTSGNPFFVAEVLRVGTDALPPSARDAVLARLGRLSSDARRWAEVAALAGASVEPAVLERVAPAEPGGLNELVDSGLLVSDVDALRFPHEITRMAVAQEVPVHRRAVTHARLLDALDRLGGSDEARLAYHAEGAGDRDAVLHLAPRAGIRAAGVGAHREAAEQFARALRFADNAEPATRADLHHRLAVELSLVDRWSDAADAAETALALRQQLHDPARESETLRFLARVMWRLCRQPEASRYAESALDAAQEVGGAALARALAEMANCRYHDQDLPGAARCADEAVALGESLDLPDVVSDALDTKACVVADMRGEWEPLMRRALQVGVARRADAAAGRAFANLLEILSKGRRLQEAAAVYEEGIAYCEEHDIATYGVCMTAHHAEVVLLLGRWDEALELSRGVLDRGAVSPANRITPCLNVGQILARRGDASVAAPYLDEAVQYAQHTAEPGWLLATLPARAEARWLAGDDDGARADIRTAAAHLPSAGSLTAGLVGSWLRRLGVGDEFGSSDVSEAYRLEFSGDRAGAARAWDVLESPYDAALALADSPSEDELREAVARFERLGAAAAVARVRRRMRELGFRPVHTGPRTSTRDHPAGLTRREQEVLALVCEGFTNDEIAGRLYISVKTVDHHVSAVLGKLGAAGRREATREARRRGLVDTGTWVSAAPNLGSRS